MAFANGASYVGAWQGGKRSGVGTAIFPDGTVKAGRWQDNRSLGEGTTTARAREELPDWPDLSRPAPKVGGGEDDVVVIVGIEDYDHVAPVPGAEQNAVDWYKYMVKTRVVPTDRVTLLLNQDATREEIRIAAEEAARLVGKKGNLWFVFIGHGAPASSGDDGLLIGFDAQQKARSLKSRSIKRSDLIGILESSRADQIHVILDACFSGKSSDGGQLVAGLQPLVVTSSEPTSDKRMTLMTAAESDQYAGPLPGVMRSAFSYLMLGGLRGWADEKLLDSRIVMSPQGGYQAHVRLAARVLDHKQGSAADFETEVRLNGTEYRPGDRVELAFRVSRFGSGPRLCPECE